MHHGLRLAMESLLSKDIFNTYAEKTTRPGSFFVKRKAGINQAFSINNFFISVQANPLAQ